MARPAMLLLDEPSLGIAPKLVQQIFESIAKIAKAGRQSACRTKTRLALKYASRAYVLAEANCMSGPSKELAQTRKFARPTRRLRVLAPQGVASQKSLAPQELLAIFPLWAMRGVSRERSGFSTKRRGKPSDETCRAISDAPHRSFASPVCPASAPCSASSTSLTRACRRTRGLQARLASDRSVTPRVRKDRRSEALPPRSSERERGRPGRRHRGANPPPRVAGRGQAAHLNAHVLRGDLDAALAMLRKSCAVPKNVSIARSVQVIERALIARLNQKLEPTIACSRSCDRW